MHIIPHGWIAPVFTQNLPINSDHLIVKALYVFQPRFARGVRVCGVATMITTSEMVNSAISPRIFFRRYWVAQVR